MVVDMIIFWMMTLKYKYVVVNDNDSIDKDAISLKDGKMGIDNRALSIDEKPRESWKVYVVFIKFIKNEIRHVVNFKLIVRFVIFKCEN